MTGTLIPVQRTRGDRIDCVDPVTNEIVGVMWPSLAVLGAIQWCLATDNALEYRIAIDTKDALVAMEKVKKDYDTRVQLAREEDDYGCPDDFGFYYHDYR